MGGEPAAVVGLAEAGDPVGGGGEQDPPPSGGGHGEGRWPGGSCRCRVGGGDAVGDGVDDGLPQLAPVLFVGFAVGDDHPPVDAPGGFDLEKVLVGEERDEPLMLPVGEQVGSDVQGPSGGIERVA